MYKIQKVKINGFWDRFDAECEFIKDVNIIIGKNGTGKTTFMNILYSVLSVDLDGINNNDFSSIDIYLISNGKKRIVRGKKIYDERYPFLIFEYQISSKKYKVRLVSSDRHVSSDYRRIPSIRSQRGRLQEESSEVRDVLERLVSLSSLSVYRLRNDDEYEIRDRHGPRVISPVDYRLEEILRGLTRYQLTLSQKAGEIASQLQKDVLVSILYGEEDAQQPSYGLSFNKDEEKSRLINAYAQLNAIDRGVRKKITFHVNAIGSAITRLESQSDNESSDQDKRFIDPFRSLEARRKSSKIIQMSLDAEQKTKEIFSQIELFLSTVKTFIADKEFTFSEGDLIISNNQGRIPYDRLSSGEKQLLILLAEALLQHQYPHIFLADEPELSLHIEWQRMVIPAVRKLNPNAQVIAATHSPEVAANYRNSILDMEDVINA